MTRGTELVFVVRDFAYGDESLDLDLPIEDLNQLVALRGEVAELAAACRKVQAEITDAITTYLGESGQARVGREVFLVSPKDDIKIRDDQRSRFWRWVDAHSLASRLFNPNDARKTGLEEMATLPDPDTGEIMEWVEFAREFFVETYGDAVLKVFDTDGKYTPKWVSRLPDGHLKRPAREGTENGETNTGAS